jgi:AcrR family transcriptional regulator
MPAPANRRKNRSQNRRNEVLDAARDLFFANGYHGTTVEKIARRAGYSKRTVYLDFLNKDELFITVCAEGGERLFEKLNQIPREGISFESAIDQFVRTYIEYSRDHGEYYRMIFSEATPEIISNCSDELRARLDAVERACLGVIVDWAERAMREGIIPKIDPWEAAVAFFGTATGIIQLFRGIQVIFSREALESIVRKTTWTLWRGLTTMQETVG